jgi:monoamine oxidase
MSLNRRQFVASSIAAATAATISPQLAFTAVNKEIDVIVIGAGLSGLETALTLEENGLRVRVIEGRDRVGGRLFTLFDLPGSPEAGGNSIANAYGRCITAAARNGVEIVNLAPRLFGTRQSQELFLGGERVDASRWANHPRNPFTGDSRHLLPWSWADAMFQKHLPFSDLENWHDSKYATHDISMHDFLTRHGATNEMIDLGYNTNISYGATAYDASVLQQAFADHWQKVNRGAIAAFSRTGATIMPIAGPDGSRSLPPAMPPGLLIGVFKAGNQRLPIAMASRVKGEIVLNQTVVAIDATRGSASVTCADGVVHRAKAVVCSMPFATLRNVAITPSPEVLQHKAIKTLGYMPISQFHVIPKKPFWESDGLSPSMWTDGLLGLVLPQRFGTRDDEITSLTVWCRGLNGLYVDRLGLNAAKARVLSEFARLRPASKGALEIAAVHSWASDPMAGGSWATFKPGQITELRSSMAKPHQALFFCGEHTSIGSRGMEGALESAERVCLEVLTSI